MFFYQNFGSTKRIILLFFLLLSFSLRAQEEKEEAKLAILCCSHMRQNPYQFFSYPIEKIFVVQNFGNVIDKVALASLEYAVKKLKVEKLIILAHENCLAVKETMLTVLAHQKVEIENMHNIYAKIEPSLHSIAKNLNENSLSIAVQNNAKYQLKQIVEQSKIIANFVRKGDLDTLVGIQKDQENIFWINSN